MFTGIIQAKGSIQEVFSSKESALLKINSNTLNLSDSKVGDSIAVDGVCLTVTELSEDWFSADVSNETMSCTTFSELSQGQSVNLERSLRLNQGIDGHLVSGHVDGVGSVDSIDKDGESIRIKIEVQGDIIKYIAKKGSICVNGVSLTVNSVEDNIFDVNIVPHTFSVTTLGELKPNSNVNLEIDQVARYVERLLDQNKHR
ncbi:MAG: riboflavin synthase [Pseudomonadota bacterium]|nr:riboflavin synthase [Pseudomonadota bacterium]